MTRLTKIFHLTLAICITCSYAYADIAQSGSSQTLIPNFCPTEPGQAPPANSQPIKSEAICIPAQKPHIAVPTSCDIVTTPGPSANRVKNTVAPAITPAPVPDVVKKPITLDQALQIAFQYSPDIQSALSLVESSRGSVDQAKAQFYPTFNLQASYTRQGPITTTQYTSGAAVQTMSENNTTTNLEVVLPLDISHQLRYSTDIALYQFQEQYLSMVSVSEQLIVDVKSAYYDLLRACGQQAVAQAAVDDAKLRLENIKAKYEEGTAPKYDVTSAEVEYDNLNQDLISAKNQVSIAQSSLNEVLGVDVNNPTQIVSSDVPVTVGSVDIPKSIEQAYSKRPDLKAAQTAVTLAKTNVKLQKTGLMPTLSLSGGPSYDFNTTVMSPNNYSWQANATINIPIWDGGVTKSKVRKAKANVQNSAASLDQTKISVAKEVRKAALNLQEAALRTQTTAQAVSLAEDALSIATDRYDAGIAVLVEVTNSQSQLTQARFNYVDAQYDYAIALAQLQRATSCQPELNQLQLLADRNQSNPEVKEAQS